MSKYEYSDEEKTINKVLAHQRKDLTNIERLDSASLNESIASTEELLKDLGYELPELPAADSVDIRSNIIIPTWEELVRIAELDVNSDVVLEDLFTSTELKINELAIKALNDDYNQIHRLDKYDLAIAAVAGIVGGLVDILLTGIPQKTAEGLKAGPLSNYIRDYFEKKFPPGELEKLAISKVPYDAQDNRNTRIPVEGLSTYYHRLLSLGHDPLLGFIIGVADIMRGTMTTIDKSGKVVSQVMEVYADRTEKDIFLALAKQITHFKSDVTTAMGLPAPLMSLFNLLQFGSIGEENQTIAEIVQGMYYEGYDFIHFCSMSIPMMIVEVIIRLGYAIKRVKEGNSIKSSIPFSTNHEKHPKLGTMLFVGHAATTSINAGKLLFTKNPMAINYPEWVAFAKYSYQQLKWGLIEKPAKRDEYVRMIISNQLTDVYDDINSLIEIIGNPIVLK